MPLIILIHVSIYYTLHGNITEPDTATQNYCAHTAFMEFSLQTAAKYIIFIW
jgi:hypothetical protein